MEENPDRTTRTYYILINNETLTIPENGCRLPTLAEVYGPGPQEGCDFWRVYLFLVLKLF